MVEQLTSRIAHRGPDDAGVFLDRELGLGHRRLSIIDLSEAGHQPMTNEDGTVVVSFNGEIYNFAELRRELIERGHTFRSTSDTEVLVHLWEDRRTSMLERLVGMFALALFDRRTRELFVARDRLGEKPLFWAAIADGVVLASEMKALSEDPRVDLAADHDAIAQYLARQYVPAPSTIYRGVRSLQPAHYGIFQAGREPVFTRYWTPRPRHDLPASPADRQALADAEIHESVRSRMVADVPVGCFLSSGIDSSLVALNMQQGRATQVQTFSMGFSEPGYDESRASAQVAEMLGVRHTVETLETPSFESVQAILQQYDQPFGDSSAIPTYLLSRMARKHVKVVLSGDGGDEAFGGYERYRLMLLSNRFELPGLSRLGRLLLGSGARSMSLRRVLGRALVVAGSPRPEAYESLTATFDAPGIRALLRYTPHERAHRENDPFATMADVSLATQIADLTTYLPDCLSAKVDIASMAHSLEVRAPLLDHRLIELGLALPRGERVRLRETKVLLRRIAARKLGRTVARRPKRGFGVPLEVWLRGSMRKAAHDYLFGPAARIQRVLDRSVVEATTARFFEGDLSQHSRTWILLAFEAWLRSPLGLKAIS
jgi:asparagine synthase (glutamine-hydrolysing)